MKKIFIFLSLLLAIAFQMKAQNNAACCPENFSLRPVGQNSCVGACDSSFSQPAGTANPTSPNGVQGVSHVLMACRNATVQYMVYPNLPGFTYSWQITGGTPATATGNPVTVTWGNITKGKIKVTISNGNCIRVIEYEICFAPTPVAGFTYTPTSPVCVGTIIQFNNTSTNYTSLSWNFGDGQTDNGINPQHTYTATGTYTVTLVAYNQSGRSDCACTDTIRKTIKVEAGTAIETCNKMLCPGDTATYCSTSTCGSYSWSATGGTIYGPTNQKCVKVVWTTPPGSLTLTTTGCGACNTSTITPNVIWPALLISGPNVVCVGSTTAYSLPVIPGTFYNWTLSGGGVIQNFGGNYPNGYAINNPQILIDWNVPGNYTLTCNYYNPNTRKNCSGTATLNITVKPRFRLMGLLKHCTGNTANYVTADGSNANWTISGVAGTDYTIINGPNNVSNLQIQWLNPGTYQLCGTPIPANAPNYCNSATPVCVSVTVNPTPVVTLPPAGPVCPGASTQLSATSSITGGSFTWSVLSGTANIAPFGNEDANATVIFSGTGPWIIQAAYTSDQGCTGTQQITINAVAAPTVTATGPACPGGQITATASGAGPFTWQSNPFASLISASGNTATYQINGGAPSATITVSNCGGSASATVAIVPPPAVSISTTGSLCAGNMQLNVSPTGISYQWYFNGSPTGPNASSFSITQPGIYMVTVSFAGGCSSTSTPLTVSPATLPVAAISTGNPLIWCLPATPNVTLVSPMIAGCTYTWHKVGTGVVGTGGSFTATSAGSYFMVASCGGCTATSNTIVIQQINCNGTGTGCTGPNPLGAITVIGCNPINFSVAIPNVIPPGCNGTYSWSYGDGNSSSNIGNTTTHTYANIGVYPVMVSTTCNGCTYTQIASASVPLKANFNHSVACGPGGSRSITLNDISQALPGWTYTRTWSTIPAVSCGSFSSATAATTTYTAPAGCSPTILLTITGTGPGGSQCTATYQFSFSFPASSLSINVPPICKDEPAAFSSNMPGMLSYAWNFGDGSTSPNPTPTHAYSGVPANPLLSLTVTDSYGCTFSASTTLSIIVPPTLSITPSPIIKICPQMGAGVTLTATSGFTQYSWYKNGVLVSGPSASNVYSFTDAGNSAGTYYVQALSNPGGCTVKSVPVTVVYKPKPKAKIVPGDVQCVAAFPASVTAINSQPFNPNYQYDWFLNTVSGTPIFTSTSTNFLTYTVPAAGGYVFIVRVTDVVTGCQALDTACIFFSKSPTVSIAPGGPVCQGPAVNLTATASPLGTYTYAWQNGQTGPNFIAQAAGVYTVTATDAYGCFGVANFTIKPLPYVALFPQGCDTLCDTARLYFPIPLNSMGQPAYTITWYEGATVIGTGFSIPIAGLGLGSHNIHAVVQMNGCSATTDTLYLFIINCAECNCKGSHWENGPVWTNEGTGKKEIINCKSDKPFIIKGPDCKNNFTISGTWICADKNCPPKVEYSLYNAGTNTLISSGTGSITIPSSLPNGSYYVNIYMYCGDKICDSCKVWIKKDCPPEPDCLCNPQQPLTVTLTQGNEVKKIECGADLGVINCKNSVSLNATYLCMPANCGSIQYVLNGPAGTTTGTMPPALVLNSLMPGNYTITITAYCGTVVCKECKIQFKVECDKKDCCTKEIKIETGSPVITAIPNASLVNQSFTISGLGGVNLTEVRAEVVSFDLSSSFKNECLSCKSLPFTWASIQTTGNIGAVPPKITIFGGTVNPFNPTGTAVYQNPREVIWNNGSLFTIGAPVGISFFLPPASIIDCCDITAKICVRFTFRDEFCNECEKLVCFTVVLKKK